MVYLGAGLVTVAHSVDLLPWRPHYTIAVCPPTAHNQAIYKNIKTFFWRHFVNVSHSKCSGLKSNPQVSPMERKNELGYRLRREQEFFWCLEHIEYYFKFLFTKICSLDNFIFRFNASVMAFQYRPQGCIFGTHLILIHSVSICNDLYSLLSSLFNLYCPQHIKDISYGEEPYAVPDITARRRLVNFSGDKSHCQHVAQVHQNIPTLLSCGNHSVTVLLPKKGLQPTAFWASVVVSRSRISCMI